MRKVYERLAGVLGAFLVTLTMVSAFNFVSQPVQTNVIVGPPTGNLQLSGSFPQNLVINTTVVGSFSIKNAANVDISNVRLNVTISESGIDLTTVTVQIAGENPLVTCVPGQCYFLSARTWLIYAGTTMPVDISLNFHRLGSFAISVWASGNGG